MTAYAYVMLVYLDFTDWMRNIIDPKMQIVWV